MRHVAACRWALVAAWAAGLAVPAAADDVKVARDAKGAVRITGSSGPDHVVVAPGAAAGSITVEAGAGTTLNGAADPVEIPADGALRVALGDGDDVFEIRPGVDLAALARIDMGAGAATVSVLDATLRGGADVRLPRGGGAVTIRDCTITSGNLRVRATDAAATVNLTIERTTLDAGSLVAEGALDHANVVRLRDVGISGGGVTWRGGEMDDDLSLRFVSATGRLSVTPGARGRHKTVVTACDFDESARVAGGAGDDTVEIRSPALIGRGLTIDCGRAGTDVVVVENQKISGPLVVNGSKSGTTSVTLRSLELSNGSHVVVRLGKGGGNVLTNVIDTDGRVDVSSKGPLVATSRVDAVASLRIASTGSGAQDIVTLDRSSVLGPLSIELGRGLVEYITIRGGSIEGAASVTTAADALNMIVDGVAVSPGVPFGLVTGGGADELRITDATFGGPFSANVGAGDDIVRANGSTFSGPFRLDGGAGIDRFCDGIDALNTFAAARTVVRVEEERRASEGDDTTGCGDATRRVSVPRLGLTTAGGDADGPSRISGGGANERSNRVLEEDGEAMVFASDATNLVAGDTNGGSDIFIASIVNEILVERVSVRNDGRQFTTDGFGGPPVSANPSVSAQARFVAFESTAADAVDDDANFESDVFLRDVAFGQTFVLSDPRAQDDGFGGTFAFRGAWDPSISGEGRDVAFVSYADFHDEEPETTTFIDPQIWVAYYGFDGTIFRRRATVRTDRQPAEPTFGDSGHPSLSFFGSVCAFHSTIRLTDDAPPANVYKVYVRDFRVPAKTVLVSVTSTGQTFDARNPTVSDDGNLVAFETLAALDPADTNGRTDVYVKDLTTGVITWASPPPDGGFAAFGPDVSHAFLAGGGRFVAFSAAGSSIRPDEAEFFHRDIFLFDRTTGVTIETGTGARGEARGDTRTPSLTPNGRWVGFASFGNDFDAARPDGNGDLDVWVQDRGASAVANPTKR